MIIAVAAREYRKVWQLAGCSHGPVSCAPAWLFVVSNGKLQSVQRTSTIPDETANPTGQQQLTSPSACHRAQSLGMDGAFRQSGKPIPFPCPFLRRKENSRSSERQKKNPAAI